MAKVELKPIQRTRISFGIRGTSPLIMHAWSEKAIAMMRDKGKGKKTKMREARDPEGEAEAATYFTQANGTTHKAQPRIGIPAMALKTAMISAAHKDIGIEKTLVKKSLFIICEDPGLIIPIEWEGDAIIREDMVRVGMGTADIRYRPEFRGWRCPVSFEIDADLLTEQDVLTLVNRAGFGVGICERRPEKGGEFGRFEIDPDVGVESVKL